MTTSLNNQLTWHWLTNFMSQLLQITGLVWFVMVFALSRIDKHALKAEKNFVFVDVSLSAQCFQY